nr:hypothetical protein [Mycolicibacterium chlorophenolicum]
MPPIRDDDRGTRMNSILVGVAIVAGVVFVVAVIFFSGFFIGRSTADHRGYHGGQMGPGGMMGPAMMGPGMMGPGGQMGPSGPMGPGQQHSPTITAPTTPRP